MRGQYTIEEQVEQLKQYLDCPCTYFPPMADDKPIMDAYRQARDRGEKEGFVPMLVVVDELLLEYFAICGERKTPAQLRQELLAAPLGSGKEFLQKWRVEDVDEEDVDHGWLEVLFEEDGDQGTGRFVSCWDYFSENTEPLILAEIPVRHAWEVFAYLPFGGWNECPRNEEHMAVAKYWFEEYGAVPAAMTHDVLEYDLPAPVPPEKVKELAVEQAAYCSDGVEPVGRLADILARSTVWFFWWD